MKLSDLSIRNPVFAWMLMLGLIGFGLISFSRMGLSQLPDVDFPTITVSLSLPGAAPEVMETQVVDAVESALMTVEGVQKITSTSKSGSANVTVEFDLDRNIDVALQDVQAKVAGAQRRLPANLDPPTISKTNPEDQPIMWLALTYDKNDPEFLMKYAKDYLQDRITTVDGVGELILGGYTAPVMRVHVRPKDLLKYNISVNDVMDAIKNEHSELPGGYLENEKKYFNVRTMGEAKSIDEFKSIVISSRGGQGIQDSTNMVRLSQVADVSMGLDDVRRFARFNGKPALGMGVKKQRGTNAVAVARAIKERTKELEKQLPEGMKLQINTDSTVFVENSVRELNMHLVLAVILTSIVCWMFLGSWSATFNVLLSIPTSLLGSFIGLYFLGYTLNTFTLLGLTLAIGIVVDDAIMVLEHIFRYNEMRRGNIASAVIGSPAVTFAAMAATAAVVAIFLPVVFMKGIIGKYFMQFGVTISIAVVLSLLESLTITPMRCASFVHVGHRTTRLGRAFEFLMDKSRDWYAVLLKFTLKHPLKVVIASILFVAVSFSMLSKLKKEMSPAQDMSMFMARLMLPVGTSLTYTNQQAQEAEKWLLAQPEIERVFSMVGGFGGGGSSDSNQVNLMVSMKPKGQRGINKETGKELSQTEFMQVARKHLAKIKDVRPVLIDLSMRGFSSGRGFPVEFTVLGSDWGQLAKSAQEIMEKMTESGLMVDVDSDYLLGMPEIQIVPDRVGAAHRGIRVASIGNSVNALIGGVKVGEYPEGGHRYDIKVKLNSQATPQDELRSLMVSNARGNLIPIRQVTQEKTEKSLQAISRANRQRAITVSANLKPGVSQQVAMAKVEEVSKKILKPGYMISPGGSSKSFQESFESLIVALVLGLFVAYMVLASQFNSFIDPVSILMALPFSLSGAFFALLVMGQSLNMYSMIGLLLLMGIVKKNSILLVEFTNTVRDRGTSKAIDALLEACPVRLRPIIMTSAATISAAVPSALASGAGSETMKPMAICLIGGVLVSTVLTLFVVPSFYLLMDRFRKRDEVRAQTKEAFIAVGDENMA